MCKQHRFILYTYRGNVNHFQSVHHPLSTLPVGIKNTLVAFKRNQTSLLSNECPMLFLIKLKGGEKPFSRCQM